MYRRILFYLISTLLVFTAVDVAAQEDTEPAFVIDEADVLDAAVEDSLNERLRDHQAETGVFIRVVVSRAFDQEKENAVDRYEESAADASGHRGRWLIGVVNPEGTSAAVRVGSDLTDELPREQAETLIENAARTAVSAGGRQTLAVHLAEEFVAETEQLEGPLTVRSVLTTYSPMRHLGAAFWLLFLLAAAPTVLIGKLNYNEWDSSGVDHALTAQLVSIVILAGVASVIYVEQAVWAAPLVVLTGGSTGLILVYGTRPIMLVATLAVLAYMLVTSFVLAVLPGFVSGFQFQLATMAGIQFVLLIGMAISLFTGRWKIDPRGFKDD
jgi:uncharacterized membrane protein YgcG